MDEKSEMDIIKDLIKERKQDLLKQLIVQLSSIKVMLLICYFRAVNDFYAVLQLQIWLISTGLEPARSSTKKKKNNASHRTKENFPRKI